MEIAESARRSPASVCRAKFLVVAEVSLSNQVISRARRLEPFCPDGNADKKRDPGLLPVTACAKFLAIFRFALLSQ
jgi:hypothetical protein